MKIIKNNSCLLIIVKFSNIVMQNSAGEPVTTEESIFAACKVKLYA